MKCFASSHGITSTAWTWSPAVGYGGSRHEFPLYGELRAIKGSPFKAHSRSEYSHARFANCQAYLLKKKKNSASPVYATPPPPPVIILFFPWCSRGRLLCGPADWKRSLCSSSLRHTPVPMLSARGVGLWRGSRTCVFLLQARHSQLDTGRYGESVLYALYVIVVVLSALKSHWFGENPKTDSLRIYYIGTTVCILVFCPNDWS